jgi:hypothetical protein
MYNTNGVWKRAGESKKGEHLVLLNGKKKKEIDEARTRN